ncbi:emerin [Rhinophrynus dorsalis]
METFKNMSDEELIAALRKRNLPYGPIVGTTRTLYEKKLFEHERSKTINRPTLGAYDSQQHYTSRTYENDDDEDTYEEETVIRTYQYPQAHQRIMEICSAT